MTGRAILHLVLHVAAPGAIAWAFFPSRWRRAWAIMVATMLVDADHLLAFPVYDPGRCSIGFHPLHTYPALAGYAVLTLWIRTRFAGLGLLLHMGLDAFDCVMM